LVIVKAGGMFSSFGLQTAAQKYISIYSERNDHSAVFGVTITAVTVPVILGSICSIILYFTWPILTTMFEIQAGVAVRIFVFAIPLYALLIVSASSTRGFKKTKYYVYIRDIGQSGIAVVAIIIASFVTISLYDVIYGYIFSLIVGCLLGIVFLYQLGDVKSHHQPTFNFKELLSLSIPMMFISMSGFLMSWTDILTLGFFTTSSAVGYYQSAYIYATVTFTVFQGINAILPAMIAERYDRGDMTELASLYSVMTKWGLYVTALGTVFVIVFAEQLLFLFGPEFVVAKKALVILAIGRVLAAAPGSVTVLLSMTDYSKFESMNTILFGLINLLLNLILVPEYGFIGAAIATAASMVGLNIVGLGLVWYFLEIQPFRWCYLKGVLAMLFVIPLLLVLQSVVDGIISLVASGVIAGILFFSVLFVLGFNKDDKFLLKSI
jgi:O-antigen/teichoic acid export membrane protein